MKNNNGNFSVQHLEDFFALLLYQKILFIYFFAWLLHFFSNFGGLSLVTNGLATYSSRFRLGFDSIITGLSLDALSGSSEHTQRNAIALSHTKSHANQVHERLMEIKSFLAPT